MLACDGCSSAALLPQRPIPPSVDTLLQLAEARGIYREDFATYTPWRKDDVTGNMHQAPVHASAQIYICYVQEGRMWLQGRCADDGLD